MFKLLLFFILTYANNDKGLSIAYGEKQDNLTSFSGTVVSSDYGPWGSHKKMYNPYLTKADGLWTLRFQLGEKVPCYGICTSPDLLHWKPQDYPIGKLEDHSDEYVTAIVDGKEQKGQLWQVDESYINKLKNHFESNAKDYKLYSERMEGDAKRFAGLKPITATLNISKKSKKISDKQIGIFFEDISYAADGGLYGELIQNRDFEYSKADNARNKDWNHQTAWNEVGDIATESPLSENTPYYILLTSDTLKNYGWDGIRLDKGEKYKLSFYARNKGDETQILIFRLVENGKVLASTKIKVKGNVWKEYKSTLTASANADKAELHIYRISGTKQQPTALDIISLFPEKTFHGHGLRKDLAEVIAALQPKFMRFPGGCLAHGQGIENIYNWKESIGPLKDRKGAKNIWHYHQTRGLGYYEFFQFCEDMGAEPLPVVAAGVPCQNSGPNAQGIAGQQGGIPMSEMGAYVQDILDLIEWANGNPATNKWAKMRADAGHPKPFNLKYIGIGNEDLISDVFTERYLMICKAIREKYPEITICGTVGPFHKGSSDYEWGWKIAAENKNIIDMVDEHYYESTGWFMHNQDYYDNYDRNLPKVYLGEYAASTKVKRSNVETALAEAIHLCQCERNGDVVAMTSYAPLLAKDGHNNWNPDLIYFNNRSVTLTPSYETQRLFSISAGDEYIDHQLQIDDSLNYRVASSVVKDSKTGKTFVKLVNALPVEVTVSILGFNANNLTWFSGKIDDKKVEVQTSPISSSVITLKPYSLNIIE